MNARWEATNVDSRLYVGDTLCAIVSQSTRLRDDGDFITIITMQEELRVVHSPTHTAACQEAEDATLAHLEQQVQSLKERIALRNTGTKARATKTAKRGGRR